MASHLLPTVWLKSGREKKIIGRYPWVQREEVTKADKIEPGSLARLVAHDGAFLAIGTYNGLSRFPFRVLSRQEEKIDQAFFERAFRRCQARRVGIEGTDAVREIFAEADGLPGLIVDRYRRVAVVQVRGMGMERLKPIWLPALLAVYDVDCVYEKSEMEGRREEGLDPIAGPLSGELPAQVLFSEAGFELESAVLNGLKTGYYLDQRDSRRRLAERVKPGQRVLDTFCYSGAFSLYAARAGAQTLGIDLHEGALALAQENAARNGLDCAFEQANAFEWLEQPKQGAGFDWIILDPPAIAKAKDKRDSLKWGVWKLAHRAVDHLAPGGRMVVCSCSYQLSLSDLIDVVRLAASDRGQLAFVEEVTLQSPDHPYLAQFPESLYLKCAWVRMEPA